VTKDFRRKRLADRLTSIWLNAAFGAATEVTPKLVSPSDAAARSTGAHGGQAFFLLDDLAEPRSNRRD
jgi:hypothetical protein